MTNQSEMTFEAVFRRFHLNMLYGYTSPNVRHFRSKALDNLTVNPYKVRELVRSARETLLEEMLESASSSRVEFFMRTSWESYRHSLSLMTECLNSWDALIAMSEENPLVVGSRIAALPRTINGQFDFSGIPA